jgi:[ribosomal protein S5]-alanine N-acetyltransferase
VFEPHPSPRPARLRPERPWREHLSLYRNLFDDPAVAARLRPGPDGHARADPRPVILAAEVLAGDIQHWQQESFGPWIFFDTATGVFVGRCGLRCTTILGRSSVELLYAVRSDSWGEGYATEMAMSAMAYAHRLRLEEVVGFTSVTNAASRRVLEKVGMRFEAIFEHAGLPHWLGRAAITPASVHRERTPSIV